MQFHRLFIYIRASEGKTCAAVRAFLPAKRAKTANIIKTNVLFIGF